MANELHTANEPSITALVGGILSDAQDLIKQQFNMLRAELKEEIRQARTAAVSIGVGAGLLVIGGILLIVMLVHLLEYSTDIPVWGCYAIVGGGIALAGCILVYFGKKEAGDVHLIAPPQTAAALRENVQWLQGQMTSAPVTPERR